jgi:hypothetical protein
MANQTKQNLTTLGQIQSDTQSAYLSAPMIAAPSTQITDLSGNARQLRDPSKTLRPAMGIERVHTKSIKLAEGEKGPNGEQVFKLANGDDRVRFVGSWANASNSSGTYIGASSTDGVFIEITFYGTGLNILMELTATRSVFASVDGGTESADLSPVSLSTALGSRNYTSNQLLAVSSGLTLGNHTIKLRFPNSGNSKLFQGFEILNENTQIRIPQGEIVSNGRKETIASSALSAYNSGFDGSPVLNGRGGRVVVYAKNGQVGKVIQQTNGTQANLASADHTNEEVIRRINFREFGVNRADDFSTLAGVTANRAFTLDDGTTTLVGEDVRAAGPLAGEGLEFITLTSEIILTFVGTGLDVVRKDVSAGTSDTITAFIDGSSIGTMSTVGTASSRIDKVVSGLPYGTHTARFTVANTGIDITFLDFITYGPKKPTIPESSVEIGEYYLMADVSAAGVADLANGSAVIQGMMWKSALREVVYSGTWSVAAFATYNQKNGFQVFTTTNTNYFEYTFYGTSVAVEFGGASANTTCTIQIDGVLNASGAISGAGVTSAGGGTYNLLTPDAVTAGIVLFTGLTNTKHTIRVTKTAVAGSMELNGLFVGCGVHFPNTKAGSLSMGPAVQMQKETSQSGVDLSKAKAWIVFDGTSAGTSIEGSYNISAFLRIATGQYIIYFEKPFKSTSYVAAMGSNSLGQTYLSVSGAPASGNRAGQKVESMTFTTTTIGGVVADCPKGAFTFFGELADEGED